MSVLIGCLCFAGGVIVGFFMALIMAASRIYDDKYLNNKDDE